MFDETRRQRRNPIALHDKMLLIRKTRIRVEAAHFSIGACLHTTKSEKVILKMSGSIQLRTEEDVGVAVNPHLL